MCFRPTSTTLPLKCPECGFMNKPGSEECLKCGATFSEELMNTAPSPMAPSAPTTPGAPTAPGAPAAPSAPTAPSAPAAPGV